MGWLTPWGTSLSVHALAILLLAILVLAQSDSAATNPLSLQLRDDLTSLAPGEISGDPFTNLKSDEPPSLALAPDREPVEVSNTPALSLDTVLGPEMQLEPPAPAMPDNAEPKSKTGRSRGKTRSGYGAGTFSLGAERSAPFSGRRPEMRAKLVRREGGTLQSEEAVERGLEWIARHQKKDGSWSLDTNGQCREAGGCPPRFSSVSDTGATGLALLPMLAAGHVHNKPGRYQQSLHAGLKWLVRHQKKTGELYTGGSFNSAFYSHAIATMALCEAYGLSGDKSLRAPAQKAIRYLVNTQNRFDGGWRYFAGQAGDTSVFGWMIFALKSASLAGLEVPANTVKRCRLYLDLAAADPTGTTYAYLPGRPLTATMTTEGLLARQYLGWPREDRRLIDGVSLVMADLDNSDERNIYYWYYATQFLHNMQGPEWKRWNPRVRDGLISLQVRGEGCDRGSWDPMFPTPDRWGRVTGRLYTTAMSLLTLEVYYRYLPLYEPVEGGIVGVQKPADDEAPSP
jgi:hypothetical protein